MGLAGSVPRPREGSVFQDGKIVCDSCKSPITRVTEVPADGWPQLHSLCSNCFADLQRKAIAR